MCWSEHAKKNRRVSTSEELMFWKLSTDSEPLQYVVKWAGREGPTKSSCAVKGMQLALLEGFDGGISA